jgi:hypothetical protein
VIRHHGGELGALAKHSVDNFAELVFAGQRNDLGERIAQRAVPLPGSAGNSCVKGLPPDLRLAALVEHLEMRCHLSFERETLQESLAEAMNGMDLKAAPRFKNARE